MPHPEAESLLRNITNPRTREAFARVDRAAFVPAALQSRAWADHPLPIEDEATISQPSLVAQMTDWLDPRPTDRVLEIGTGSGYQTAILAEMAAEIDSVEFSAILSQSADERLRQLGYANIRCHCGDGAKGWPENAPYDRILATVAFPSRPRTLLDQLAEGGRCLAPVGAPGETQSITRYQKEPGGIRETTLIPVRFLSLRK